MNKLISLFDHESGVDNNTDVNNVCFKLALILLVCLSHGIADDIVGLHDLGEY